MSQPLVTATNDDPQQSSPSSSPSRPNHKRKFHTTFETTRFGDIVGHGAVKLRLEELLLPLALPYEITEQVLTGIRALPTSILLYGPPGCGKTQLARAIAGEARAAFYCITPSDVLSKFVGESEAAIRHVFQQARCHAQQLESKCAVVFWDEMDALGPMRKSNSEGSPGGGGDDGSRRLLAQLLLELNQVSDAPLSSSTIHSNHIATTKEWKDNTAERPDRFENDDNDDDDDTLVPPARVLIVGATNRPEDCDPALLRRFGIRCFVGPPHAKHRRKILQRSLQTVPHNLSSADLNLVVNMTDQWSGSDLQNMAREAAMAPVRECIRDAVVQRKRVHQQPGQQTSDADGSAQRVLMEGLQKLRPVLLQDFARAIDFSLWKQDEVDIVHYDSSSEEEDNNQIPGHDKRGWT